MKNKTLIIVFLLSTNYIFLQNLVNNPSFEDLLGCPESASQLDSVIAWYNPTQSGTPDLYNACASFGSTSVPYGMSNYQYAHFGNGYAGIISYVLLHFGVYTPNVREYLQTELLSDLEIDKCYLVSMYINNNSFSICGINNLGIAITQTPPNLANQEIYLLNANPQVYSKKIIADTLNWIKISGIVTANSGERYLTIGNFFQDSLTEHIEFLDIPNYPSIRANYLIDDVTVIPIDSISGGMPAYAGADTTIFIGDSLFLGQDVSNLSCTWYELGNPTPLVNSSPYESSIYVSPTDTTSYVVEQNLCGTITFDTVTVNTILKAPIVSANAPLNFCSGESVVLTVDAVSGIEWSPNGETTPSITVSESGTYFVTHTFNEYTAVSESVTTTLTATPQPTISSFPEMCDTNAVFTFTQGSPSGGVYTVNGFQSVDFDPNSTLIGDNMIEYSLTNGNCIGTASTVLTVVGCTVGLEQSSPFIPLQRGKVFPNPNDGSFTIDISNTIGIQELSMLDALGRTIKHFDLNHSKFDMELSSGVYFVEVVSENGRYLEKIVVN